MKKYKIIILGPPGSGKGTQAKLIAEHYGIDHVSTGDIFREKKKEDSELGRLVKELIDNGRLVPDDITIKIVEEKVKGLKKGYLLDGFPRTVPQAEALDKIDKLTHVLYIEVSEETLLKRITSRRVCECGESYHLIFNPPKEEGICNKCGKEIYQRVDDAEDKVKERLKEYDTKTKPLLDYYKKKLIKIDGELAISEIFEEIKKFLG